MDPLQSFIATAGTVVLGYLVVKTVLNSGIKSIKYEEAKPLLAQKNKTLLLDVRTPTEFAGRHAKGALNIPSGDLKNRLAELDKYKDKTVIVICASGARSALAARTLHKNGFTDVLNFSGGMTEWRGETQ
ncbi:rhodanese-like domain-containing protein [Heliophilum fasciatum]|uniref:Rhodanese-related sulfurtransferase n=1 Tax=Heliophilum fasciatum TaxID=35700 RepID=A0A4R2RV04_9FIRM|nr:rhodanese-like domain-containing protein [Heliophilum fasciatum]MCW2277152.1 rhodanese-related sulfurtransferase [Heliophilum fasciatum]TCP68212.1 rhodanese-related sulfurtransferase [Heliophilum fasciatum]